nr:hypothetical protein [Bacteroidota bacterium]
GKQRNGERTIVNDPYEPYDQFIEVPFPSGQVEETPFFRWDIDWIPRSNIRVRLQSQVSESNLNGNQNYVILSIDAYLPTHFEF